MFQTKSRKHTKYWIIPKIVMFIIVLSYSVNVYAQDKIISNSHVSLSVYDVPFHSVLVNIEQQIPYKFAFSTELITRQRNITLNVQNKPLDEVLLLVLKGTNISYSIIDNQIVLEEVLVPTSFTISGYIRDSVSGESLPGAIIYLPEKKTGTYSNKYGFYSITQNKVDSIHLIISYAGYNKISLNVNFKHNSSLNFYLSENKFQLNSIVITRNHPDDNLKKNQLGRTDFSMEMVKAVPSVDGHGDIINTIQMMPGVMAGLDGRPGYFIRGGNTDQNLVQLDEATLYNPNHLLGLVSIFNSSAIKSAYLLKAGFPASFGDHLSSVLDVTMKEGNDEQFGGDDWQLVTFSKLPPRYRFSDPKWTTMTPQIWKELKLKPKKKLRVWAAGYSSMVTKLFPWPNQNLHENEID